MVQINRPQTLDVTRTNPREFVYIKGSADVDGSIRLLPDSIDATGGEVQLRTSGVWNTTSWQVAAESIDVGLNISLSSGGDWLVQNVVQSAETSIVPHLVYDDTGSELYAKFIKPGVVQVRQIGQPDDSGEFTGVKVNFLGNPPVGILNDAIYFKTGATAATAPVRLRVAVNNFAELGGDLIYDRNQPVTDFPANTEIKLDFIGLLEGNPIRFHYFTLSSDEDFSLLTAVGNTNPWVATDLQEILLEDIMTSSVGMDRVLTDNDAHIVSDISGNLILDGEPPQ
jgi:hypothetical protein